MKTVESVLPALNTQGHSLDRIYSLLWQDRCGWNKIPGEPRRELGTAGNLAQHCYEIQAVEGQAGCQQLLPCISLCTLPVHTWPGDLGSAMHFCLHIAYGHMAGESRTVLALPNRISQQQC